MTPKQFRKWLAEMREAGYATTDDECAKLIGISRRTLLRYKHEGASFTVALACKNVKHKLGPYQ